MKFNNKTHSSEGVHTDSEDSENADRVNGDQVLDKIFFSKRDNSARRQTRASISEAIGKGLH